MIYKKALLLYGQVMGMALLPPDLVCGSCLLICMLIVWAKSWSAKGASHRPAFMSSCLTISYRYLSSLHRGRTLIFCLSLEGW